MNEKDRAEIERRTKDLRGRGMFVKEDADKKTVAFAIDAKLLMTISDAKLYKLSKAALKVQVIYQRNGYAVIANGEVIA